MNYRTIQKTRSSSCGDDLTIWSRPFASLRKALIPFYVMRWKTFEHNSFSLHIHQCLIVKTAAPKCNRLKYGKRTTKSELINLLTPLCSCHSNTGINDEAVDQKKSKQTSTTAVLTDVATNFRPIRDKTYLFAIVGHHFSATLLTMFFFLAPPPHTLSFLVFDGAPVSRELQSAIPGIQNKGS